MNHGMRKNTLRRYAFAWLFLLGTPLAAAPGDGWIGTWATAPQAALPGMWKPSATRPFA